MSNVFGGSYAPINPNYIVDQDGSQAFTSRVIDLLKPLSAINYQMKWEASVLGRFIWEASIFPDPYCWEALVNCEEVELLITSDATSGIVSLPNQWLTVGFIRFRFEPFDGSVGLIQAAIRAVPI